MLAQHVGTIYPRCGVMLCARCENGAFCMEFDHFRFESVWVVLPITIQIIFEYFHAKLLICEISLVNLVFNLVSSLYQLTYFAD